MTKPDKPPAAIHWFCTMRLTSRQQLTQPCLRFGRTRSCTCEFLAHNWFVARQAAWHQPYVACVTAGHIKGATYIRLGKGACCMQVSLHQLPAAGLVKASNTQTTYTAIDSKRSHAGTCALPGASDARHFQYTSARTDARGTALHMQFMRPYSSQLGPPTAWQNNRVQAQLIWAIQACCCMCVIHCWTHGVPLYRFRSLKVTLKTQTNTRQPLRQAVVGCPVRLIATTSTRLILQNPRAAARTCKAAFSADTKPEPSRQASAQNLCSKTEPGRCKACAAILRKHACNAALPKCSFICQPTCQT